MKKIFFVFNFVFLVCLTLTARPVKIWEPEELLKKADVVIIAMVKNVKKTNTVRKIMFEKSKPLKLVECEAELDLMYVIKGKVDKKCKIRYNIIDPKDSVAIINGPAKIRLVKGETYLLYLKKTKEKDLFINALNGDMDDFLAAKQIPIKGFQY